MTNFKFQFGNCKSKEDIKNVIENVLEYENIVADDNDAAQWFKDADIEGDVTTHVILSTHVSVWNEEYEGEEMFNVIVKEHFVDAGSDDYVYSYMIN